MGNHTTPENKPSLTLASPVQTAALADVLRTCLADDALVAQFDRLTCESTPVRRANQRGS